MADLISSMHLWRSRWLVILVIILITLSMGVIAVSAQSGAFVGIENIACDETGYSISITPDPNWTQAWCEAEGYYYSPSIGCIDIAGTAAYRLPTIQYAPASDPLADTWANLGKNTATVYYNIHWMYSDVLPVSWTHIFYPTGPDPGSSTVAVTVDRADCLATPSPSSNTCAATKRYFMYALEDVNQPSGWPPYCYIISHNGIPGVPIQASLCTPPGSDHTFRATNIPFGGWVSTDCRGQVFYDWSAWDPGCYRPEYAE
jgi:hypothetical protein